MGSREGEENECPNSSECYWFWQWNVGGHFNILSNTWSLVVTPLDCIGKALEVLPLWPTKSFCLSVLLCSALNSTDTNLLPTQTKARYFLPAQYAELACGGIKETPDSVILSKVKLQRLGNGSAFPSGCDQRNFHHRNTRLTTPFQISFKLGSCTLWYVF